ncbi:MAG: BLUF domain-containing protein [Wenzhouxiangellaceae bacterium]|nr:BLUF domain-containing protein [Wenzhouxiangellaceae bacterium]
MDESTDLIGLSYCSRASFPASPQRIGVDPEVNRILVRSRRNNRSREIGGVLHFGNGCFFQYLEGPADEVDSLFATISRDERHHDVRRLTRRAIPRRRFSDWSMKFVAIEAAVDRVLRRHGLGEFDPYAFTPALIDDLVMTVVNGPDHAPEAVPTPVPRPRRSLWQRLFG